MKKRAISILLTVCLLAGLLPAVKVTAHATGDITLSVQNDSSVQSGGPGTGYGPELTSGEAGSTYADPGIKIYYTDYLTGSQAGQVGTYSLTFAKGGSGIEMFHAKVDDPTTNYWNQDVTGHMVIEKTDGSCFQFKQLDAMFGGNVILVIKGYLANEPVGNAVEYTVSNVTDTAQAATLNTAVLNPAVFGNVDKVTITGRNYNGTTEYDGRLDTGTVFFVKSVTVGDPIVPPTLSSVSASNPWSNGATLSFTSSKAGTYYYLVYAAGDAAPSAATVKAQGTAVAKGSGAAAASANSVNISGLSEETAYKVYVLEEDDASNVSAVGSAAFTTTAKTVIPSAAVTVAAPAKGAVPSTTASAESGANYTVSAAAWSGSPSKFLGGTAYTATFTLTPNAGYKFTADTTVAVTGATVTKTLNSSGTLAVSAAYPALSAAALTAVAVKTQPTKTAYAYGESFAPAGLVITQTFDDGSTADVTYNESTQSAFTFSPTTLAVGMSSVALTYGGKTASIPISVAKQTVTPPAIASAAYTGEKQTAAVAASSLYTVTANAGGTNAGDYDVVLTLAEPANYKWSDSDTADKTLTFTIAKADATSAMKTVAATISSLGKTGATATFPALPAGAAYGSPTYAGAVVCSNASVSGTTLTFNAAASTAGQTGTITIPVSGATNYNNYDLVVTLTSFAKTQVAVAGIAAVTGLIYTGSPQSGYTGTATVTGHTDLDAALVYTYASTDGAGYNSSAAPTAAGAYRLTVSVPESNETYTGSASVDFTIAPKELTVTGLSAVNRAYNGAAAVALTGGTLTGVIGSDNVSTTMPTTGTVAAAGIGEAKAVTVVKPSLTGTAAANYTLANLPAVTVDISPAVITVTGAGSVAVTKPYDGTAAAGTLSGTLAFSGKVGTEDVSVSATPGAYDANAFDAGTGKTVELTLSHRQRSSKLHAGKRQLQLCRRRHHQGDLQRFRHRSHAQRSGGRHLHRNRFHIGLHAARQLEKCCRRQRFGGQRR